MQSEREQPLKVRLQNAEAEIERTVRVIRSLRREYWRRAENRQQIEMARTIRHPDIADPACLPNLEQRAAAAERDFLDSLRVWSDLKRLAHADERDAR